MYADRLDADPLFARIRLLDLECPQCGRVFRSVGTRGPYNARTGLFTCPPCNTVFAIGLLVYPVTRGPVPQKTPPDWVPTPRQALALRQLASGHLASRPIPTTAARNLVIRQPCRCLIEGTRAVTHPQCPIHGAPQVEGTGQQPKAKRRLMTKHLQEGEPGELDAPRQE